MSVEFTQYLRPDGRKKIVWIDRSPDVESKAEQIKKCGYVFEIEELMNGTVSMTIEDYLTGHAISSAIIPNGPAVPIAVDNMIGQAFEYLLKKGEIK